MSILPILDRLGDALDRANVPRWEAPESSDALDALTEAVAPLRLPAELRTLWETVAIGTSNGLRVEPYPRLISPEFALDSWHHFRLDLEGLVPPNLCVLVGYESHACMSVELDMDGVQGGTLFDWFVSSFDGFDRRFNHLHEWLDYIAAAVERGDYERSDHGQGPWLRLPGPDELHQRGDAMPVAGPHPNYDSLNVGAGGDWPQHWDDASDTFLSGE
jgi:hypothetical protein